MASKLSRIKILPTVVLRKNPTFKLRDQFDFGIKSRLPQHYVRQKRALKEETPQPVHDEAPQEKYWYNKSSEQVFKTQYFPIPEKRTQEQDKGLWGGESIIDGFRKPKKLRRRMPQYWVPHLQKRVLYSEILDRWMEITVTLRALDLIDESHGLDHYILKTHERDLKSQLGCDLKREMMSVLLNKTLYTDNPEKQEEMMNKYSHYVEGLEVEEVEWLGLSVRDAVNKQRRLEQLEHWRKAQPLKDFLTLELLQHIKDADESGVELKTRRVAKDRGWLSKLNPFQSKPDT